MAYGNAPYSESSLKSALRIAAAGLGSVPRGANFGTAFAAAAGGASKAYGAAEQAAQEYAVKQQQQQEQGVMNEFVKNHLKAQTDALSREKTPPPPKKEWWQGTPEERQAYIDAQSALAGATARAKGSAAPPKDATPPMTDAALDMTAEVYAKTGLLPSLGMGKSGAVLREKILERAASKYPGVDVAQNKAGFGSDQASLKNLQGNYDQTKAFGNTFEKNAAPIEKLVYSIPNLGFRYGNSVGRWLASQAGSSHVSQFHTQMGVVRPEAQRILQFAGTGGNMALTDHQAKDMRAILGDDFTPAQLRSSLAILRQDRENKLGSYAAQIQEIRGRLRNVGQQNGGGNVSDPLGIR